MAFTTPAIRAGMKIGRTGTGMILSIANLILAFGTII
jgi:hypothetical protein